MTEEPMESSSSTNPCDQDLAGPDVKATFVRRDEAEAPSHDTSTSGAIDLPPTPRRRSSLGRLSTVILILGAAVSLATLEFLSFLWFGAGKAPGGKEATMAWRTIMLNGWLIQVVTLSSVLLRVVQAFQAGVATSLVAALVLQDCRVPLSKVAHFTVMRGANGGPGALLYLLVKSSATDRARILLSLPGLLACALFLGTLATQFTSTILVSDLGFENLVGFPIPKNVSYMLSSGAKATYRSQFNWGEAPRYISFGETPSRKDWTPNEDGFSDSGVLTRAFIPFRSNITTLRRYEGPAYIVDSRVSCMRPAFTEFGFGIEPMAEDGLVYQAYLSAILNYTELYRRAKISTPPSDCADFKCLPDYFNCTIPTSFAPHDNPAWHPPSVLCISPQKNDSIVDQSRTSTMIQDLPISPISIPILVVSSEVDHSYWASHTDRYTSVSGLRGDQTKSQQAIHGTQLPSLEVDEWTIFQDSYFGAKAALNISVTICFLSRRVRLQATVLNIDRDAAQPSVNWDAATQTIDTGSVRRFLGDAHVNINDSNAIESLQRRGIFNIDSAVPYDDHSTDTLSPALLPPDAAVRQLNERTVFSELMANLIPSDNAGKQFIPMCYNCPSSSLVSPSQEYRALFTDTLHATSGRYSPGRAVVALDGLLQVASQAMFYGFQMWFDVTATANLTSSITQRIALGHTGLVAVQAIVGINSACVLLIVAMFLGRASRKDAVFTRPGNPWHALAQVVGGDSNAGGRHRSPGNLRTCECREGRELKHSQKGCEVHSREDGDGEEDDVRAILNVAAEMTDRDVEEWLKWRNRHKRQKLDQGDLEDGGHEGGTSGEKLNPEPDGGGTLSSGRRSKTTMWGNIWNRRRTRSTESEPLVRVEMVGSRIRLVKVDDLEAGV